MEVSRVMAVSSVFAFWAVAVLLIVVPGTDWAFTLGTVVRGRPVAAAVGGLVIGYAAVTVVVAAGIGGLLAGTPAVLAAFTVAGGGYLIWVGVKTLCKPVATFTATAGDACGPTTRATLLSGIGVSGLNPKTLLMFIALLPQYVNPRWSLPLGVQLGLLGLLFTATCGVFYTSMGMAARAFLDRRPTVSRSVSRVSGCGMILIGAGLLVDHFLR